MTGGTPNMRHIASDESISLLHWYREHSAGNSNTLQQLMTYLPQAMETELTDRQRQMIHMYFYEEMNITQIAQALSLNPSSVSRTLHRATRRLLRVLRYAV